MAAATRPKATASERLIAWVAVLTVLAVGASGFALLASVRHPPVAKAAPPAPGAAAVLFAPEADPGPPAVELRPPPPAATPDGAH